jgi:hypothetical protein
VLITISIKGICGVSTGCKCQSAMHFEVQMLQVPCMLGCMSSTSATTLHRTHGACLTHKDLRRWVVHIQRFEDGGAVVGHHDLLPAAHALQDFVLCIAIQSECE